MKSASLTAAAEILALQSKVDDISVDRDACKAAAAAEAERLVAQLASVSAERDQKLRLYLKNVVSWLIKQSVRPEPTE